MTGDDRVHSGSYTRHASYPHWPGMLYDCPACEAECFCEEGFVCIACATMLDEMREEEFKCKKG